MRRPAATTANAAWNTSRGSRTPPSVGAVPPASGTSGSASLGSRFARLNARAATRSTAAKRRIDAGQVVLPRRTPNMGTTNAAVQIRVSRKRIERASRGDELVEESLPPPLPDPSQDERGDGGDRGKGERDHGDPRDLGSRELDRGCVVVRAPPGRRAQRPRAREEGEHADRREARRAAQRDDDRNAFGMEDLPALVAELVVDPLPALVNALDETRTLQLLKMLEKRRLAEAHEVAQVRDRLAPSVDGPQHPH